MAVDIPNMTPISQHHFSLASVSYIGPAYTEPGRPPLTPQPQTNGLGSGQQGARH